MIPSYRDLTRLEMEQLDRKNTIVLLPLGALEQHGNQAPLGTDAIIAEAMAERLKRELPEDFPMLVFPVLPVGLSTEHKNFCGSITFHPDTYYRLLHDICESLVHHGFQKLVFLICHGGNAPIVQVLSRELRSEYGIFPFYLSSGAFSHPDVKATVSPGNVWDFHGGEICNHLKDGSYYFPFIIYREQIKNHNNLSMANRGFENPCELIVKDHEGLVYLAVKTVSAESMSSGKKMEGRVNKMQYLYDGEFRDGGIDGRYVYFPVTALNFIAMGKGRDTLLHGSVCLKMQCSVGDMHMPESTAVFTMFIH